MIGVIRDIWTFSEISPKKLDILNYFLYPND